jgi:ankyrin repeat protein
MYVERPTAVTVCAAVCMTLTVLAVGGAVTLIATGGLTADCLMALPLALVWGVLGVGLLKMQPWSRVATVWYCGLSVVGGALELAGTMLVLRGAIDPSPGTLYALLIPGATALAVSAYMLYALTRDDVRNSFDAASAARRARAPGVAPTEEAIRLKVLVGVGLLAIVSYAGFTADVFMRDARRDIRDAAAAGDIEGLKWSLFCGADPDAPQSRWMPDRPIHAAASAGQTEAVRFLIERGADPHAQGQYGTTALSYAAERGHAETVELLLSHGADPNVTGMLGETPLGRAMAGRHHETARVLLANGAEVQPAGARETPLGLAAQVGDSEGVELLIAHGADPRAPCTHISGDTALHMAAEHGHAEVARALIAHGAKVNVDNALGDTPLKAGLEAGQQEVVVVLREHGAKELTFVEAAREGRADVVREWLDEGVRLDLRDRFGATALHVAASRGHAHIVSMLLAAGADCESHAPWGEYRTPLALAEKSGHDDVVRILRRHGARL